MWAFVAAIVLTAALALLFLANWLVRYHRRMALLLDMTDFLRAKEWGGNHLSVHHGDIAGSMDLAMEAKTRCLDCSAFRNGRHDSACLWLNQQPL